jgi:hypothetical protein
MRFAPCSAWVGQVATLRSGGCHGVLDEALKTTQAVETCALIGGRVKCSILAGYSEID